LPGTLALAACGGAVTRLDASTGRRTGRAIDVGPEPTDVAVGGGAVWVANSDQGNGTVSRIDPRTAKAREPIELVKGQVFALTYGEGGVWVAGSDETRGDRIDILRIDPSSSSEVEGSWCASTGPGSPCAWPPARGRSGRRRRAARVWRLERAQARWPVSTQRTGAGSARLRLPGAPTGVSVGEGAVWVAIGGDGAVARVDPALPRR